MWIHRWFIGQCDDVLRRDFAAAMEETLARRLAEARGTGAVRYWQVWWRELTGLAMLAAEGRWGSRPRAARRRTRQMSNRKAGTMDAIAQEVSQAARRLRRSPAFTLASVVTLALAIGANASIFAVLERIVLNPLPYPDSDRLIEIDHGSQRLNVGTGMGTTAGLYFHYAERSRLLQSIAIFRTEDLTVVTAGEPERLRVTRATPSLGSVLQVPAAIGRWFGEAEGVPGAAVTAVLSHSLWVRRFGQSPEVVGRSIAVGGVSVRIIGVMPASFAFPDSRVEIWLPMQIDRAGGFGLWSNQGVARLREGVTYAGAHQELTSLIEDLPTAFSSDLLATGNAQSKLTFAGRTLKDATIGGITRALWVLLGSVAVVLLVACANVANLFLVRSDARQREVAVRRALGASSARMARYFLTESLLLSLAAGVIGLGLAWGAVRLLVALGPATLPRLHEIRLDGGVFVFTIGVSMLAALLFGVVPMWRGLDAARALNENGRSNTPTRSGQMLRHVLMGAQVALALILLVASGLIVRSFQNLRAADPGFDGSSAVTFNIGLGDREYPTKAAAIAAHQKIMDGLSALAGVTAVSATTCLPLAGGCAGNSLRIEGRAFDIASGRPQPVALFRAVAGGYFETMGMRLVRGRTIDRSDVDRQAPVAVVSESLARRIFPDEDPIGRRVASNLPPAQAGRPPSLSWLEIVGVIADTPVRALAEPSRLPQLFMPLSLAGGPETPRDRLIGPSVMVMSFVVRTATPPSDAVPSVRRVVAALDPGLALAQVRTLQEILDRAAAQMAFTMVLLMIAAGVALLLGVVGVYGVMCYVVSQRTSEIGVRLALGAAPGRVAGQILRQGAAVTAAGAAIGLVAAIAGGRLIDSLLYGVSARDPLIVATMTGALAIVALAACWVPARRAARLSPADALRAN
jgi:predicted permease